MNFKYIDAHSHVQESEYDADREELLNSFEQEGIGTIVVGVDKASSMRALALAKNHKNVFASIGKHPTENDEPFDDGVFEELARSSQNVAIGECGLEYYRIDDIQKARAKQVPLFEKQIELAVKVRKPLMIHARPSERTMDAYKDIIDLLQVAKREYGDALTGNVHFFAGGIDETRAFLELDFTVSYTAVITFAREYDETIRFVPLTHLIAETDSPYVAPASNRGARNDPRAVKEVVRTLAEIRNEEEEAVRLATVNNTIRVFNLTN